MTLTRTVFLALLLTTIAVGKETDHDYQQGTITKNAGSPTTYEVRGPDMDKKIANCGDFQTGQAVDYRVEGDKVYIRRDGGKEYKCTIEASYGDITTSEKKPPTYQQGTIMGYGVRRDSHIMGGGGGGGPANSPSSPVSTWTRKAKVYELKGSDLMYQVDYCGSFQAGKFKVGDVVDYRVDHERLYIRHDNDKEYSCQIEGTWALEGARTDAPSPNAKP